MKKLLVGSILFCVCLFTLSATPQKASWEYKFEYKCDEKKANALAAEGWELVNMGVTSFGSLAAVHCAFKRPK